MACKYNGEKVEGYSMEQLLKLFEQVKVGDTAQGFEYEGTVYVVFADVKLEHVKIDVSDEKELFLRNNMSKRDKQKYLNRAFPIGNYEELRAETRIQYTRMTGEKFPSRNNSGWVLEYAIAKWFGKGEQWQPDNRALWLYPDFEQGATRLCIKYENARLLTASNIREMRKQGII